MYVKMVINMPTLYDSKKETSLIPNTLIERMFMSICTDEQMSVYLEKANSENPAIRASATAYASSKVERMFMFFRDKYIREGGDLEYLGYKIWNK